MHRRFRQLEGIPVEPHRQQFRSLLRLAFHHRQRQQHTLRQPRPEAHFQRILLAAVDADMGAAGVRYLYTQLPQLIRQQGAHAR